MDKDEAEEELQEAREEVQKRNEVRIVSYLFISDSLITFRFSPNTYYPIAVIIILVLTNTAEMECS